MKLSEIKIGSLYKVDGVICRATLIPTKSTILVTHHKRFKSLANPRELHKITKTEVLKYLKEAKNRE